MFFFFFFRVSLFGGFKGKQEEDHHFWGSPKKTERALDPKLATALRRVGVIQRTGAIGSRCYCRPVGRIGPCLAHEFGVV